MASRVRSQDSSCILPSGLSISSSEIVRQVHNSFHRRLSFEIESSQKEDKEDAFHFVTFIWHGGKATRGPRIVSSVSASTKDTSVYKTVGN